MSIILKGPKCSQKWPFPFPRSILFYDSSLGFINCIAKTSQHSCLLLLLIRWEKVEMSRLYQNAMIEDKKKLLLVALSDCISSFELELSLCLVFPKRLIISLVDNSKWYFMWNLFRTVTNLRLGLSWLEIIKISANKFYIIILYFYPSRK